MTDHRVGTDFQISRVFQLWIYQSLTYPYSRGSFFTCHCLHSWSRWLPAHSTEAPLSNLQKHSYCHHVSMSLSVPSYLVLACVCPLSMCMHMYTYPPKHTTHVHMYSCTCTHACMHTCTHIHLHTHLYIYRPPHLYSCATHFLLNIKTLSLL